MSKIICVKTSLPKYRYSQQESIQLLSQIWPEKIDVLRKLLETSGVSFRNFVMPIDNYPTLAGFGARNDVYLKELVILQKDALYNLQKEVGLEWKDVGALVSTSITGIAVPSLEARLMNEYPINRNAIRIPIFGLGCLGGVASLNRANEFLNSYPEKIAIVLASEACSLTFQMKNQSMANMVATSLFGDGVAAVCLAGEKHPLYKNRGLKFLSGLSSFYPDTEKIMGWDITDDGLQVVLSGSVPELVTNNISSDVDALLKSNDISLNEIQHFISHPGGPKVLKAIAKSLLIEDSGLAHSWSSLKENGNMSSVSVLDVLQRSMSSGLNGVCLMLALGPAFCSELSLLRVE